MTRSAGNDNNLKGLDGGKNHRWVTLGGRRETGGAAHV
jgi:hypothetical protein